MTTQRRLQRVKPPIALWTSNTDGRWDYDWGNHGKCKSTDADALFIEGKAQNDAKAVCIGCPVVAECLADALDNRTDHGVWGGMTERERRALLRQNPNVKSWTNMLQATKLLIAEAMEPQALPQDSRRAS